MDHVADGRVRYRDALAVGEFRVWFVAYTVSTLGSVVAAVALMVLVYERTGSPFLSALTFGLGFLPYIVSGLLLSAVVDRVPPRRLLSSCDLTCAALVALMAWPKTPVPALLVLLFAVGTVSSVAGGARGGLVRMVVGDAAYVPARSLLRISSQSAQILGNGLGGLLLIVLSPRDLILVNAASFAFSAALTRFGLRRRPAAAPDQGAPLLVDSLRGAGSVLGNPVLRRLLLLGWLVPLFMVWPEALAAPYVIGGGDSRSLVGWWLVAIPIGVIVGDLAGVWLLSPDRQKRLIAPIAAAGFVPYVLFVGKPSVEVAIPLLALAGTGAAYFLGLDGLIRDVAPRSLFARTMAISQAGTMTIQGLGFAAAGALAEWLHPATVIACAGVCGIVAVALLRPRRP
jgi:MFS family permease